VAGEDRLKLPAKARLYPKCLLWPAPEKVDGSKVEFWGVEGRQNEHEEESIQ